MSKSVLVRLVAAIVAVGLVALTVGALVSSGPVERAPGLAADVARSDAAYQLATSSFVERAQGLKEADVRTTLSLYDLMQQAAARAQGEVDGWPSVAETAGPTERMSKALRVQQLALTRAVDATRNGDPQGAEAASREFQVAVLAYRAARQSLQSALSQCASRCR